MARERNEHHIVFKFDKKCGLVPKRFDLNNPRNKVQLPIKIHDDLHALVNENEMFRRRVDTRIYLANMAYNDELQDVPERLYLKDPITMRLKR